MNIHIITIFPESFDSYFSSSIMKNAKEKWLLNLIFYKLNDFSSKKTKRVDEKAYWMHWQVISPVPLSKAIESIFSKYKLNPKVVYLSPKWDLLTQKKIIKYKKLLWNDFIIICWHYEWIDQRIIDLYVDYEISIWKYIISSWELASMVFIDSLTRTINWVLWNNLSFEEESFSKALKWKKEYPIYTRPQVFMWKEVPEILFSWNEKEIQKWKQKNLD